MARANGAVARRARVERGGRWSAAEKAKYLSQFATSGLSAAAFVRKTGLPQSTFDLWRSEHRRRRGKRPTRREIRTAGFAQVEVVRAAAPSGITLVVRSAAGVVAKLRALDAASAGSLLEVALRGPAR